MSLNLMRLLGRRTGSAPVARERLQILLAHERGVLGQPDLVGILREEILAVVSRHVTLDPDKVMVKMDRARASPHSKSISSCPTASNGVRGCRRTRSPEA